MAENRPLILVTNDDGIYAEGIKVLADQMTRVGDVVTVAPDREKSAASHSVTLHHPLRVTKIDEHRYAVDGTPTDCVLLGVLNLLPRRPDILVSGINRGANLGDDVTYSGTVAAAFEGTLLGVPSFAISVIERIDAQFDTAAEFAVRLAKLVLANGLPPETLLNVNVPNLPSSKIAGVSVTLQGKRIYKDQVVEKSMWTSCADGVLTNDRLADRQTAVPGLAGCDNVHSGDSSGQRAARCAAVRAYAGWNVAAESVRHFGCR